MKIHELKCDPEVFEATRKGLKNFELRKNDRLFGVDDLLHLRETFHSAKEMSDEISPARLEYTGRHMICKVMGILDGGHGLQKGFVAMSIEVIHRHG